MLISKFKKGDVITIKLTSAEEVIAEVLEDNEEDIVVKKPMTLVISSKGMGLQPYMITPEIQERLHFHKQNIFAMTKTAKDFTDGYLQQTSGIQIAGASNKLKAK